MNRFLTAIFVMLTFHLTTAAAQQVTIAITAAETNIHREPDAASPVFATVPKDMKLIVKGQVPGWIKISGPNQRDAWVAERLVRIESREINKSRGETPGAGGVAARPSDSWTVGSGDDALRNLTARVERLEDRVRELEQRGVRSTDANALYDQQNRE